MSSATPPGPAESLEKAHKRRGLLIPVRQVDVVDGRQLRFFGIIDVAR